MIATAVYLVITISLTLFTTKQLTDHYLSIYIVSDNTSRVTTVQREISSLLNLVENIETKLASSVRLTPSSIAHNGLAATELMYNFRQLHPAIGKIFYLFTSEENRSETVVLTNFGYISDTIFNNRYGKALDLGTLITSNGSKPFLYNSVWADTPIREEILYIFPETVELQNDRFFVFQLNVEYLRSIMDTGQTAQNEQLFIFDVSGKLLLSLHPQAYMQTTNLDTLLQKLDPQSSMLEYGGETFYTARIDDPSGLCFVRLIAMGQFVTQALYANTLIVLLMSVLILAGLFFLWFSFNYFHKPITRLVRSITEGSPSHLSSAKITHNELDVIQNALRQSYTQNQNLRSQIEHARPTLIAMFINNLIRARYITDEQFANSSKNLNIQLHGPLYTIVCIEVLSDKYIDSPDTLYDIFTTQMPEELIGYISVLPGARIHNLILSLPTYCDKTLCKLLQRFKSNLFYSGVPSAISLGETVYSLQQIGHSYISAYSALQYRFIQGSDGVLTWQDAEKWENNIIKYPTREMQLFIAGLNTWNAEEIVFRLDNITNYIIKNEVSLRMARFICHDIISAFSNAIAVMNRACEVDLYRQFDLLSLMEFTSLRQLCSSIVLISEQISDFITKNARQQTPCDAKLIIDHIRQNVTNPNFTIESIADYFQIPYKNLRAMFKNNTGQTLLECYQFLRMEEVKRLLMQTSEPIETIASCVGYTSASSLIRSFRQEVGMSPGKYREQNEKAHT